LFGEFQDAIEAYCQKDRLYFDHQGNATLVPGLAELPFNICGFIDDTIDPILVPFSGLAGNFEGAPRRPQYILAQESVYTGYKKLHGHKMETVFFPNGMSNCFGTVSARQNDRGTLAMSGLDRFLVLIQAHLPPHLQCMVFGNSIFCGNMLRSKRQECRLRKITAFRAAFRDSVILGEDQVMALYVPMPSSNFGSVTSSSTVTYALMAIKPAEPILLRTLHLASISTSIYRNVYYI
jgi:hypothetical protein